MKVRNYREIAPDPVGEEGASGITVRWVITEKDGASNFSMRVFEVEPGGYSPYHEHPWEHEVFILEGQGDLVQGNNEVPFSKGDVIFIPPDEEHQLRNTSKEPLEFICLTNSDYGVMHAVNPLSPSMKP
jgi:quercetin dioxygenase-like cupin family protein